MAVCGDFPVSEPEVLFVMEDELMDLRCDFAIEKPPAGYARGFHKGMVMCKLVPAVFLDNCIFYVALKCHLFGKGVMVSVNQLIQVTQKPVCIYLLLKFRVHPYHVIDVRLGLQQGLDVPIYAAQGGFLVDKVSCFTHGVLLAGHEALVMWVIGKVLHQFLILVEFLADEIDSIIEREPPAVAIRVNPKANGIDIAILVRKGYFAALVILLAHK